MFIELPQGICLMEFGINDGVVRKMFAAGRRSSMSMAVARMCLTKVVWCS